jgi:hypothetical protein
MISTYDLVLLGLLISLGGIAFLFRAYRRQSINSRRHTTFDNMQKISEDFHGDHHRAEFTAGVRWLTLGALTLFIGYTRGAESGYIFGLWTDILFHVGLLSVCWFATFYRLKYVPERRKLVASPLPANITTERLETTG